MLYVLSTCAVWCVFIFDYKLQIGSLHILSSPVSISVFKGMAEYRKNKKHRSVTFNLPHRVKIYTPCDSGENQVRTSTTSMTIPAPHFEPSNSSDLGLSDSDTDAESDKAQQLDSTTFARLYVTAPHFDLDLAEVIQFKKSGPGPKQKTISARLRYIQVESPSGALMKLSDVNGVPIEYDPHETPTPGPPRTSQKILSTPEMGTPTSTSTSSVSSAGCTPRPPARRRPGPASRTRAAAAPYSKPCPRSKKKFEMKKAEELKVVSPIRKARAVSGKYRGPSPKKPRTDSSEDEESDDDDAMPVTEKKRKDSSFLTDEDEDEDVIVDDPIPPCTDVVVDEAIPPSPAVPTPPSHLCMDCKLVFEAADDLLDHICFEEMDLDLDADDEGY